MNIIRKTNGYEISKELLYVLEKFTAKCEKLLNVKEIEFFYYGDRLVMTKVRLQNDHYGDFNITNSRVSFNGCECSHIEHILFGKLTWHDECYAGELFK